VEDTASGCRRDYPFTPKDQGGKAGLNRGGPHRVGVCNFRPPRMCSFRSPLTPALRASVKKLLFASLLVALEAFTAGGAPLKIAVLAPLTGYVSTFGASTRNGAFLAIDQWNARGGVLGTKITAVLEDSQCAQVPAEKAANKVITQDHVHYIIGEVCSRASIPIAVIANKAKVIQISPSSTEPGLTVDEEGRTRAYVFRACFIDPFQGIFGASFAIGNLKAHRAFIILDPANSYSRGLAESFEASFKAQGGRIVGWETYDHDSDVDFSAILSKARDARPDIIYLPDSYSVVNLVTRQARLAGVRTPFLGGDGWDSADLDTTAADGAYFTDHFSAENPRPEVQAFRAAYGAAYKDANGQPTVPDALAALAYDATNLLLRAISRAGVDNTDRVRLALEDTDDNSVTGRITYDSQHNPEKPAVVLSVRSGKVKFFALVEP
jgi:branched-chain amino acid transport system substrate-binding protein